MVLIGMLCRGHYELFEAAKRPVSHLDIKVELDVFIEYWRSEKLLLYALKSEYVTWEDDSAIISHAIAHNMVEVCK